MGDKGDYPVKTDTRPPRTTIEWVKDAWFFLVIVIGAAAWIVTTRDTVIRTREDFIQFKDEVNQRFDKVDTKLDDLQKMVSDGKRGR